MLPLLPFLMGRVTCTECGKDEVGMRAGLAVGLLRKCTHCGKSYRVTEVRNVTSKGTGRPAPKPAVTAPPRPPPPQRAPLKKKASTTKAPATPTAKKKAD